MYKRQDKYSHSRYLAQQHAEEERRRVSQPDPSSDSQSDDNRNDIVYTQQNQQSTLSQQGADSEDETANLDDRLHLDTQDASSSLTTGKYVTDTDTIHVVRNDILDAVITQPHDPSKDMRVDIDTKPSSNRRIRTVDINTRSDPIEVRIATDPVDGMIEDLPRLEALRQEAKDKRRLAREERSRQSQLSSSNTQDTQHASQSSQTRYELRKRLNSTKTYTVWHILKPP